MTSNETFSLIRMIESTYPNFKPDDIEDTIRAWAFLLSDFDYKDIALAFKTYVMTNNSGFAPSLNNLIALVNKPVECQFPNEMEAWALVDQAVRRSGYYAEEEFSKLPKCIQKAVGSPSQLRSWATDDEYNQDVCMSQFIRTYRTVVAREKELIQMPNEMRIKLQDAANTFRIELKGAKNEE